jgi:hypothetical protein
MDPEEFRKQYEAELEQATQQRRSLADVVSSASDDAMGFAAAAPSDGDDVASATSLLTDRGQPVERRLAALQALSTEVGQRPELIDALVALVGDANEPAELRKDALTALQAASFQISVFAPKRPVYLNMLRSIVGDSDTELRRRAIGILAREQDEYIQQRLLAGLQHTEPALVPASKAIQFLGYDPHAEYYPVLRQIVEHPPNQAARKEAVRVLGTDPDSAGLLAGLATDKSEKPDVRIVSAIALQSLDPTQFERLARGIVLDANEDEQVRSTSLNALTHFANPGTMSGDKELADRVEQLRTQASSPQLKRATASFISRFAP